MCKRLVYHNSTQSLCLSHIHNIYILKESWIVIFLINENSHLQKKKYTLHVNYIIAVWVFGCTTETENIAFTVIAIKQSANVDISQQISHFYFFCFYYSCLNTVEVDLLQPMLSHSMCWLWSYTFISAGGVCTRPHGEVSCFLNFVIVTKTYTTGQKSPPSF